MRESREASELRKEQLLTVCRVYQVVGCTRVEGGGGGVRSCAVVRLTGVVVVGWQEGEESERLDERETRKLSTATRRALARQVLY